MNTPAASRGSPAPPPLADQELSILLAQSASAIQFCREIDLVPEKRAALIQRRKVILAALEPSIDFVVEQVEVLAGMLGTENFHREERSAYLRKFIEILKQLPPFALGMAVSDFVEGRAGNRRMMPRAAEVRFLAEMYAHPARRELATIGAILTAPLPSKDADPAARESVLSGFSAVLESWPDDQRGFKPRPLSELLAEFRERGLPRLSPLAANKLSEAEPR